MVRWSLVALVVTHATVACAPAARSAEPDVARSCAGVPESEARALFRDDVERVEPLTVGSPKLISRYAGAVVYVRARPGVTPQWLARVLGCHVATDGARGSCSGTECPLAVVGVTSRVSSTETGFAISLRTDDPEAAREVLRRAQRLTTAKASTKAPSESTSPESKH